MSFVLECFRPVPIVSGCFQNKFEFVFRQLQNCFRLNCLLVVLTSLMLFQVVS